MQILWFLVFSEVSRICRRLWLIPRIQCNITGQCCSFVPMTTTMFQTSKCVMCQCTSCVCVCGWQQAVLLQKFKPSAATWNEIRSDHWSHEETGSTPETRCCHTISCRDVSDSSCCDEELLQLDYVLLLFSYSAITSCEWVKIITWHFNVVRPQIFKLCLGTIWPGNRSPRGHNLTACLREPNRREKPFWKEGRVTGRYRKGQHESSIRYCFLHCGCELWSFSWVTGHLNSQGHYR